MIRNLLLRNSAAFRLRASCFEEYQIGGTRGRISITTNSFSGGRVMGMAGRTIYWDAILGNHDSSRFRNQTSSEILLDSKNVSIRSERLFNNFPTDNYYEPRNKSPSSTTTQVTSSSTRETVMKQFGLSGQSKITSKNSPNSLSSHTLSTSNRRRIRRPLKSLASLSSAKQVTSQNQMRSNSPLQQQATTSMSYMVPVSAIHIAEKIDMIQVLTSVFGKNTIKKKLYGNKHLSYCVVMLEDVNKSLDNRMDGNPLSSMQTPADSFVLPKFSDITTGKRETTETEFDSATRLEQTNSLHLQQNQPRFVAVFPFGSVVFFDVPPQEKASIIAQIKKYSFEPVLSGSERRERYSVLIQDDAILDDEGLLSQREIPIESTEVIDEESNVAKRKDVTPDYCIVHKELDMNGVSVISNIMAQTVALDTYSDTVDVLLTNFAKINTTVKKTGKFTSTDRDFLFKTVAQNNSIFIDMISKTRIKDRSDTAWNLTKYHNIHYGLKEEFEIDDRFENIEFKLNLIQQNAKFFMEILHYESSNKLEWVIVVLILAECILMMTEMSGNGDYVFGTISKFLKSLPFISSTTTMSTPASIPEVVDAVDVAISNFRSTPES